jgi:hypothetical protein
MWFHFFMKLKSQRWIWRSRCNLNLAKIKFEKKWNLQSPWRMEDSTLPSFGASFKKWGCYRCTPTPKKPTPLLHARALNIFFKKGTKKLFLKKSPYCTVVAPAGRRPPVADQAVAADQQSAATIAPLGVPHFCNPLPFSSPLLPRLLLKTSNIHNFWSVGPKNMIFFPRSLLRDTSSQKVSKI